jgi:hypothetical protein
MISFHIEGDIPTTKQTEVKQSAMPEYLAINDCQVFFMQSNLLSISLSDYSPDINNVMEKGLNLIFVRHNELYVHGDDSCRKILSQFPREIFYNAPDLLKFYDSLVIAF